MKNKDIKNNAEPLDWSSDIWDLSNLRHRVMNKNPIISQLLRLFIRDMPSKMDKILRKVSAFAKKVESFDLEFKKNNKRNVNVIQKKGKELYMIR